MSFVIIPKVGIGPVRLGMNRDEVRRALGAEPRAFRQNAFAESDTDYFMALGIQADYDCNGLCDFITALEGADPHLLGRPIFGMSFQECLLWLRGLDADVEVDEMGCTCRNLRIGIYTQDTSPDGGVEAVHVFADSYYD